MCKNLFYLYMNAGKSQQSVCVARKSHNSQASCELALVKTTGYNKVPLQSTVKTWYGASHQMGSEAMVKQVLALEDKRGTI